MFSIPSQSPVKGVDSLSSGPKESGDPYQMLKSMTGFGRAVVGRGKDKWVVEIRSLNHRFFEYSSKIPQNVAALEGDIKNVIQSKIRRGKITLSAGWNGSESLKDQVVIDEEKIDFYYRHLRKIASRLRIDSKLTLHDLVSLPNIFQVEHSDVVLAQEWPRLERAVRRALDGLLKMKTREGAALGKELLGRLVAIDKSVGKVKQLAANLIDQYQTRLQARVGQLTLGLELDRDKLVREVAIMADRSDITEEVVRLGNHLKLFRSTLREGAEAGKTLDFIIQEMNRETNTIGSKALSFEISREVVRIKSELEKIREQVQNIE